jgi:uncharacterized protein (DUF697 family)
MPATHRRPAHDDALPALPASQRDIAAIARRCRKLVMQRAMLSAGASVVPVPGLDLMVDVGVLTRMLQQINAEFGLTPAQIEALAPKKRLTVYKAVQALGASAVGRVVTREVVVLVARGVARRVALKATARYVPIAGQVLAASLSFVALKYLGERHIADCVKVAGDAIDIN